MSQIADGKENVLISGNHNDVDKSNIKINQEKTRYGNAQEHTNINKDGAQNFNYNMINALKRTPKEIDLVAIVNNNWFTAFTMFFLFIVTIAEFILVAKSGIDVFIGFGICAFTISFLMIAILEIADKFARKFPRWHLKNVDGTITYDKQEYRFYENIWDMQYKPNFTGFGGRLVMYVLNPETKNPFELRVNFAFRAKAKYIYDSFHNQNRISAYLNTIKDWYVFRRITFFTKWIRA